jgi:hypothetical protein
MRQRAMPGDVVRADRTGSQDVADRQDQKNSDVPVRVNPAFLHPVNPRDPVILSTIKQTKLAIPNRLTTPVAKNAFRDKAPQATELASQFTSVPVAQVLDAGLDGGRDPRAAAILAIVVGGEAKIPGAKFDDGDRVAARRLKAPIALKPFGNQPIVLGLAGLRAMRPQIMLNYVERDDGLPAGLVLAVLRKRNELKRVGLRGFEPPTSASRTQRSSQAELQPDSSSP